MNLDVLIIDDDAASRAALQKVIEKQGLDKFCAVYAPAQAQEHAALPMIWLGSGGNSRKDDPSVIYFTKPVRAGSILESIRQARMRRKDGGFLLFGPYRLDRFNHELMHITNRHVTRLTEKESQILQLLGLNPGAVISRRQLLDHVWCYGEGIETHTLETHIYRLRQKIEQDPARPLLLITEGEGYKLDL